MTATTQKLLSQLAYAKHREANGLPGATHGAVQKAIKSGRLQRCLHRDDNGKVLIDPAVADNEWGANTNAAKRRDESVVTAPVSQSQAPAESAGTGVIDGHSHPAPLDDSAAATMTLAEARAIRERYSALLTQLDYDMKSGRVIDANEARTTAFKAARRARDMLLTIADRLAPVVAGLSDQFECHKAISAEVLRVCNELNANPLGEPADGASS